MSNETFEAIFKLIGLLHEEVKTLRSEVAQLQSKLAWHESVTHGSSANADAWGDAQGFARPRPSPDSHGF